MPNFITNTSKRAHAKAQLDIQLINNNKKIYKKRKNRFIRKISRCAGNAYRTDARFCKLTRQFKIT